MKRQGFTLIEMIVVIGIIGLLAAAATLTYNKQRVRSREVKRIQDVSALKNGLELYLTEGNTLPLSNGFETLASTILAPLISGGFMPSMPTDPLPSGATDHVYCQGYAYWTNVNYGNSAANPNHTFKGQLIGTVRYAINFGAEMTPVGNNVHPLNDQVLDRSNELNCTGSRYQAAVFEK